MGQEILTKAQKNALSFIASEQQLADFYLSGGTALAAYYLRHRISDDLDFFAPENPDMIFLHEFAKKLKEKVGAQDMRFEKRYDRNQFFFTIGFDELKIEFTTYPFPALEVPTVREGIRVDSLRDIAANKFMAMLDRFDPKDFADLFFILLERELDEVRRDAEKKFGITVTPLFLGGELAKVRRIEALPKMIKPLSIGELKKFFEDLIRNLGQSIF